MEKLRLNLEDLQVESFATTPNAAEDRGTVYGYMSENTFCIISCVAETCDNFPCGTFGGATCGSTCDPTCGSTCQTCGQSCGGTCNTCGASCGGTCGFTCDGTCGGVSCDEACTTREIISCVVEC